MSQAVVAIANTSEDIIELLRFACEREGWATVAVHLPDVKAGRTDFVDFLKRHDPTAIIFDIAPPYDANWAFVETLRKLPQMRDRAVVFTTTHKPHLERLIGQATSAVEIVGKPNDINDVIQAVKRALAAR